MNCCQLFYTVYPKISYFAAMQNRPACFTQKNRHLFPACRFSCLSLFCLSVSACFQQAASVSVSICSSCNCEVQCPHLDAPIGISIRQYGQVLTAGAGGSSFSCSRCASLAAFSTFQQFLSFVVSTFARDNSNTNPAESKYISVLFIRKRQLQNLILCPQPRYHA